KLRGRPAPGGSGLRLGQSEVHDAPAIAVHPKRSDEVAARIDHRNGVALMPARGVARTAGDDRLGGTCVEGRRARICRSADQSKQANEDLLHAQSPKLSALSLGAR